MERTLGSSFSSAELCRRNGWGVGVTLKGQPVRGDGRQETIRLTAIGEGLILARRLKPNGEWSKEDSFWDLSCRAWEVQP